MVKCQQCGKFLSPQHQGPCPFCGSEDRHIYVSVSETVKVTDALAGLTTLQEYLEYNKPLFAVVLIITFGAPFLGLYIAGWHGVLVGLFFSVLSLLVGLRMSTKVKDKDTHHYQ